MSHVKLISTSSLNILYDIAYMARVSNPSNQNNTDTNEKLIRYLIKHKHWSPFEMASVAIEINTTRDIAHQIVRHRSFAFQEFSQRYANPDEQGYPYVVRETRLQDAKNRQNSIDTDDELLHQHWVAQQTKVIEAASQAYNWALDNGIAKEQARAVLPEGQQRLVCICRAQYVLGFTTLMYELHQVHRKNTWKLQNSVHM